MRSSLTVTGEQSASTAAAAVAAAAEWSHRRRISAAELICRLAAQFTAE